LYRAMAWLGEEMPAAEQDGSTPFAPRCLKPNFNPSFTVSRRKLL
jgi:hypothetical protein